MYICTSVRAWIKPVHVLCVITVLGALSRPCDGHFCAKRAQAELLLKKNQKKKKNRWTPAALVLTTRDSGATRGKRFPDRILYNDDFVIIILPPPVANTYPFGRYKFTRLTTLLHIMCIIHTHVIIDINNARTRYEPGSKAAPRVVTVVRPSIHLIRVNNDNEPIRYG
jgi:hypothetical protein